MAYSTSNPPNLLYGGSGGAPRVFVYSSTDAHATVEGAGYFTDGYTYGMRVGDTVFVHKTVATQESTMHQVITATQSTGAVTISAATLA